MKDFSQRNINEIDTLYKNILSMDNLEEQQSDVSKQWERGARWFGRATDKYFANPVSGAVKTVTDYTGQALSGVTKAATGGKVDLEAIGKKAEKIIGTGGGKPALKPATAKPAAKPTAKTSPTKPTQVDVGRSAGEYLAPSAGSPKAADPVVRSGGRYGFFGAVVPTGAKSKPKTQAQPKSQPSGTSVKRDSRGAVIVNHLEIEDASLVTEAPAQVAPIKGTGGRGWYQKNKQGKYVPITDPELAKQAAARWKAEQAKQKQTQAQTQAQPPRQQDPKPQKPAAAKPKPAPESPAVREYMKAAASARKSGDAAQMGKVRNTGLDIWRKKYADTLAKNVTPAGTQRGTGQSEMSKQAAELRALRPTAPQSTTSTPEPQAQSKLSGGAYSPAATARMSQRTKNILGVKEQYDAFDLVLEYLLSQGHVDTLEEALYVMMEMSSETVQEIVEGIMPEPINPEVHRRLQRIEKATKLQQGTKGAESQAAGSAVKRMGGSGVQLPGV